MRSLATLFGKKTAKNLSPSRRAQIFGGFLPEKGCQRPHGTLYARGVQLARLEWRLETIKNLLLLIPIYRAYAYANGPMPCCKFDMLMVCFSLKGVWL